MDGTAQIRGGIWFRGVVIEVIVRIPKSRVRIHDSGEVFKNDMVQKLTGFRQVTKALNHERCMTFRGIDEEFLRPQCIKDKLCE